MITLLGILVYKVTTMFTRKPHNRYIEHLISSINRLNNRRLPSISSSVNTGITDNIEVNSRQNSVLGFSRQSASIVSRRSTAALSTQSSTVVFSRQTNDYSGPSTS